MRFFGRLLLLLLPFGACTPEAIEVDPASAGAAGDEPSGTGAAASTGATASTGASGSADAGSPASSSGSGGSGGASGGSGMGGNSCAPFSSPNPSCTSCIPTACPAPAKACEGTACSCGDWGGYQGQMNCLLACKTLSPMITAANACAASCGFNSLPASDPTTHALFDCLVNPPMGPPLCPECFPVH